MLCAWFSSMKITAVVHTARQQQRQNIWFWLRWYTKTMVTQQRMRKKWVIGATEMVTKKQNYTKGCERDKLWE
jgi:hypothetical protein